MLRRLVRSRRAKAAHLERAAARHMRELTVRNMRVGGDEIGEVPAFLWRQQVGHRDLMRQPFGGPLERRGQVEDDIAILAHDDTAVRKAAPVKVAMERSEEHTSELQSLMRISYAVICLKKKKKQTIQKNTNIR